MPTQTKPARKPTKHRADSLLKREFDKSEALRIIAVVAIAAICVMVLVGLFAPGLRYSLVNPVAVPIDSAAFLDELEPLVNSKITRNNKIEVIENGDHFYPAEMDAMRQARHSIDLEAYIFHKGKLTDEVLQVLTERARAGVHVNLVLDAAGSLSTRKSYFKTLKEAGGKVDWYHRLRLHNWFILNNRTHREITLIDGSTAFIGAPDMPTGGATEPGRSRAGAIPWFASRGTPSALFKAPSWKILWRLPEESSMEEITFRQLFQTPGRPRRWSSPAHLPAEDLRAPVCYSRL